MKRALAVFAALLVALAAWAAATAPPPLDHRPPLPAVAGGVDHWIQDQVRKENAAQPVIPGTEKRLAWHQDRADRTTAVAVLYIHGFSATRQEISPVPELIADRLQANLFETRLSGHGLAQGALTGVTAESWLDDGAELLAVGRAIGERLVVIGTSTGATLALALLDHPEASAVSALVLIAPNFGPADTNSELLTRPGGLQLARLLVGPEHRWEPANELQARYWATAYPIEALVEMMRLVNRVRDSLPLETSAGVLTIYSPHDTVIDTAKMRLSLDRIDSPLKRLVSLPDADDAGNPGMHILAGNIMAPQNNRAMADLVVEFVLEAEKGEKKTKRVEGIAVQ